MYVRPALPVGRTALYRGIPAAGRGRARRACPHASAWPRSGPRWPRCGNELSRRTARPIQRNGAATALIQAEDVRKVFRNGRRTVTALDGVSIEVGAHESVGIVGESGSGKTTLARILVGLEEATGGQIAIDGIPARNRASLSARDQRKLRSTVQIVFQDPYSSLNPMRSIGSILREAIAIGEPATKDRDAEVGNLLRSVGLPVDYAARKPVALSGGERQRVAIARVLAAQPRILICDEPVSALDMSVQAQILNLLITLRSERGLGYLFITHDLSIVRQVTEHLYVMHRGKNRRIRPD